MFLLFITALNELLGSMVVMLLAVLLLGVAMKKFNQPYFVAYISAGIVLGPYMLRVFTHADVIATIGELGLIIQMFFIGTKLEIQSLAARIRKPLAGVLAQLLFSFLFMVFTGWLYGWSMKEVMLFSFIISLSSSAIILEYLEKNRELGQPLGTLTSGILILQDFLLVPMLLAINFLGHKKLSLHTILLQIVFLLGITVLLREVLLKRKIRFPFPAFLHNDHELQVFTGLLCCFGFAWLTQAINLSAGIGALIAGLVVSQSGALQWLERNMMPFRVFFLSLFFVSIGLQINVDFLLRHAGLVLLIVSVILVVNSAINALVFRLLKESWRNSIYAGALLSQIGEFSLVLCLVARNQQLVSDYWYQLTLAVVSVTMLMTAIWINIIRRFFYKPARLPLSGTFTAG